MERRKQHEGMSRTRFPDGFRYMHGKLEYVSVESMEKATQVILNIAEAR